MTLSPAQREQRRAAGRKGGASRAKTFTADFQRAARACVSSKSNQRNGRKGWKAAVCRHGEALMAEHLAHYRREHPSDLEQIVIAWLDEIGVIYSREIAIGDVFADFVIRHLAVEADSDYWHADEYHQARDARKDAILQSFGYHVLRLGESEIRDGSARGRLETALRDFAAEPAWSDEPIPF